jgi:ACS family glucarate transporter-like MFS transporter
LHEAGRDLPPLMSTLPSSDSPTRGAEARGVPPTHVRWVMVGMLTAITALTYVDRLNLGMAGNYIQSEFHLSTQTMGWVLSAFVLGYALCQIPGGWAGDRFGPRSLLTFAIVWWSIFTALTALAPELPLRAFFGVAWSFIVVRFLVGIGEATAFPNSNKIVAYWLGESARGTGNSIFLAGIGLGGTFTPIVIAWIMQTWGWRTSFYACGAVGIVVAVIWHNFATSRPEDHPRVNAAELALIRQPAGKEGASLPGRGPVAAGVPWKRLLSKRSTWFLMLSYMCEGYPNYIFYTWFFIYLVQVRGFTLKQGGFWGAVPYLAVVILSPLGGWLSDRAVRKFGKRRGRQSAVWLGMTLSAVLLTAGAHAANNAACVLLMAGALGFNMFSTASWWAACIDLAPNYSGSLSAMMNTCGNLAGWISPVLTAVIATHFGWIRALDFAALITFAASILWFGVNASQNLETLP